MSKQISKVHFFVSSHDQWYLDFQQNTHKWSYYISIHPIQKTSGWQTTILFCGNKNIESHNNKSIAKIKRKSSSRKCRKYKEHPAGGQGSTIIFTIKRIHKIIIFKAYDSIQASMLCNVEHNKHAKRYSN